MINRSNLTEVLAKLTAIPIPAKRDTEVSKGIPSEDKEEIKEVNIESDKSKHLTEVLAKLTAIPRPIERDTEVSKEKPSQDKEDIKEVDNESDKSKSLTDVVAKLTTIPIPTTIGDSQDKTVESNIQEKIIVEEVQDEVREVTSEVNQDDKKKTIATETQETETSNLQEEEAKITQSVIEASKENLLQESEDNIALSSTISRTVTNTSTPLEPSKTTSTTSPKKRVGKKPLPEGYISKHDRWLLEVNRKHDIPGSTSLAIPTISSSVEESSSSPEKSKTSEVFGPGWGDEPTPGEISRANFLRLHDYDNKFPKTTKSSNENNRDDRRNDNRVRDYLKNCNTKTLYTKEYFDERDRVLGRNLPKKSQENYSKFPIKRVRSRSPKRDNSIQSNNRYIDSGDDPRSRQWNHNIQRSIDLYNRGEDTRDFRENYERPNMMKSNSNMYTSRERSLSSGRESALKEQSEKLTKALTRIEELENNFIGLVQLMMNDVAQRSKAEPQPAPMNRVESSANTSEGERDRIAFNLIRLSRLETMLNERNRDGGDVSTVVSAISTIPIEERRTFYRATESIPRDERRDIQKSNMLYYGILRSKFYNAKKNNEDTTEIEKELNAIPKQDIMEYHYGKLKEMKDDDESSEDSSALMATFEFEIVTDNLWTRVLKVVGVVLTLFIIELVLT